ncbi:MAG: hypothetical protein GX649_13405 [Chloroflexi bacterium]|nr:hypothetical protein [Chloroflexota bacterium]
MTPTEITCPYCNVPGDAADGVTWHRCEACGRLLSAAAQRAYARGHAHYEEALEGELTPLNPKRPGRVRERADAATIQAYQQAHSSLELAFQSDLPESQRSEGLLAMAEITQVLAKRDLLSPLEANYWVKVLVEHNTLAEQADLAAKLAEADAGPLRRWRWQLRQRQLAKALTTLRREIADLEETIAFVEPPHARGHLDATDAG